MRIITEKQIINKNTFEPEIIITIDEVAHVMEYLDIIKLFLPVNWKILTFRERIDILMTKINQPNITDEEFDYIKNNLGFNVYRGNIK